MTLKHSLSALALAVRRLRRLRADRGRRELVQLPGRTLEDRRGRHQGAAGKVRRQVHQRRRRRLAREAARRHRRPDLQGRQGADRAGDGQGRDPAGREQGHQAEDPGHRLRPADRGAGRVLHHLRQQGSRPHAGRRRAEGAAQGQLRDDQGLAHRPERQLPARRPGRGAGRGDQERRHQDRRRGVHRRLEARGGAEEHGADPHQERRQGGCGGGQQRRHRRRRGGRAHRQGAEGRAGVGAGRRPCGAEPRRAGHADGVGVEGCARPGPRGGERRGGAGRRQEGAGRRVVERRREEDRTRLAVPEARGRSPRTTSTWSSRPAGSRRTTCARAWPPTRRPAACK